MVECLASIKKIEAAITQLPVQDVAKRIGWLTERHAPLWGKQIEDDLDAGRLDALMTEGEKEYKVGLAKPW